MSTVRLKRLTADFAKLKEYVRLHPRIRLIQFDGDPPERYQLEYRINSLRMVDGVMTKVKSHMVEIVLPRNYPRCPPQCRMLSPVFHPNIAPHAICVGDHWSSGEPLASIVTRIGELLAYQVYNVKSPLNGEAARWVEENQDKLPLDSVSLLVEESPRTQSSAVPPAAPAPAPTPDASREAVARKDTVATATSTTSNRLTIVCPSCEKKYRGAPEMLGQKVKCLNCDTVFVPTAAE